MYKKRHEKRYIAIPNTKVKLKSGLIAGLVAAAAYTLLQSFYVFAQFTTSKFNAIYGSFAALPLFLVLLYLLFALLLTAAGFAVANRKNRLFRDLPGDSKEALA